MSTVQISPSREQEAQCSWGEGERETVLPRAAVLCKLKRENRTFVLLLLLFGKLFELMKRRTPNKCAGATDSIISCAEFTPFLVLKGLKFLVWFGFFWWFFLGGVFF